ncbi:MAG: hypothetical protein BWX88_04815 [Planctomycetes bacterium ADurb.Bin126]|nr:MAG: hypothetical protein BWX88_04815 [Planctomycetes bacterium ADurb.Bin126]HOD83344.1 DUF255 domain-containing protein [Phycisphaerae bacterium]HQL75997.1 DUF255 domain-containing protein [Phycisphaerae bacterium]
MTTAMKTHNEIHWADWSPDTFERARREDKLVLVDSGATWCHWCHVMDHVTYEDANVVDLVRCRFVSVRIDRDRNSELDAYLQRSVPVVRSQGGGWPLTVVMTGDGHVLYKATFLPPRADARYGATAGLIEVLTSLEEYWRRNRAAIAAAGEDIRRSLAGTLSQAYSRPAPATADQVGLVLAGIYAEYDETHGGFGREPKFFNTPALELLLERGWQGDPRSLDIVVHSLESMARGGVYDQLAGGFHRYSVDARWHVPHFEKMAYDNAALLGLYANAWSLTGRPLFRSVALHTLDWVRAVLLGNDRRGFYASQDADLGPGDDGDYFTWTAAKFRDALGGQDEQLMASWYDVDDAGDMLARPGRNVLHTPKTLAQQARMMQIGEEELKRRVEAGRRRLLQARLERPAPAVDRTVFADLNGMLIDACLTAWQRLGRNDARDDALAALDALLNDLRDGRGVFAHYRDECGLRRVGALADQAWMLRALLHATAATSEDRYLEAARKLADYVLAELTESDGAFRNLPAGATGPAAVPPLRAWEDSPVRSAASVAAQGLIDLAHLTGQTRYGQAGRRALDSLTGAVSRQWGAFLAGWAQAVEQALRGPRTVTVIGTPADPIARDLSDHARRTYVPGGYVIAIDPARNDHLALLAHLGYQANNRPLAYVCRSGACLAPAHSADELRQRLDELKRAGAD